MIKVNAYAKINWSLNILSRRPNGYHELDMLMQKIDLCDEITFEPCDTLILTVNGESVPDANDNLVIRAANALNAYTGERFGAKINLVKHIPSRAGLGGGSADCACALKTLNEMWQLKLDKDALSDIALRLGADVPFELSGQFARVGGIGENIVPYDNAPEVPLCMATPGGGLSTGDVFRKYDTAFAQKHSCDIAALAKALTERNYEQVQTLSYNALEAPAIALMPEIKTIMNRFGDLGARFVRMSGSGSTVFGVFDTFEQAQRAAEQIDGAYVAATKA